MQIDSGTVAGDDHAHAVMQASLDELARMRDLVSNGTLPGAARDLIAQIRGLGDIRRDAAGAAPPPARAAPRRGRGAAAAGAARAAAPPARRAAAPHPRRRRAAAAPRRLPRLRVAAGAAPRPPRARIRSSSLELSSAPVLPGREAPPVERVEMARVDADLLDTMLNNAGEVSIFRARLDQQVNSIDFNLAELARTVTRLKEQLRGLEIETEAQVLQPASGRRTAARRFRSARAGPLFLPAAVLARARRDLERRGEHSGFARDLDARGAESADAAGAGHHRAAEQPDAHAHGALPAPCAALDATGAPGGERHRQARGTGRAGRRRGTRSADAGAHGCRRWSTCCATAVVHGIETPERRAALGKPDVGRISISLERDGAEIVIVVADDGAGINVKLIREKAIALGLDRCRMQNSPMRRPCSSFWSRASAPPATSRRRRAAASAWMSSPPKSRSWAAACSSTTTSARDRDSRFACPSPWRSARP